MSLVQTPADDPKMAAEEDHEVAAATKSGRPTAKDAALLAFVSSIGLLLRMRMSPPLMK